LKFSTFSKTNNIICVKGCQGTTSILLLPLRGPTTVGVSKVGRFQGMSVRAHIFSHLQTLFSFAWCSSERINNKSMGLNKTAERVLSRGPFYNNPSTYDKNLSFVSLSVYLYVLCISSTTNSFVWALPSPPPPQTPPQQNCALKWATSTSTHHHTMQDGPEEDG
jgi:hypothetical protein